MLGTIGVGDARWLPFLGLCPRVAHLMILRPLKPRGMLAQARSHTLTNRRRKLRHSPVEKDPRQRPLKVLAQSGKGLLEYVGDSRVLAAPWALVGEVVGEDLGDGMRVRDGHQLVVFGDVLPVVDEDGLDVVRDGELDGGAGVEALVLGGVSVWQFST